MIIVVDDEDRENEGDFIAAAEKVTPETIDFMITHGRGQLCMPILPEGRRAARAAARWSSATRLRTRRRITVPVDHRSCRTGISAAGAAPGRFARSSTRQPGPTISSGRGTCSRWSPRKGACCAGRAIPRPPSIWPGWPA